MPVYLLLLLLPFLLHHPWPVDLSAAAGRHMPGHMPELLCNLPGGTAAEVPYNSQRSQVAAEQMRLQRVSQHDLDTLLAWHAKATWSHPLAQPDLPDLSTSLQLRAWPVQLP